MDRKKLVTTAGIEPATYSLGNCCSIQLSYVVVETYFIDDKESLSKSELFESQLLP